MFVVSDRVSKTSQCPVILPCKLSAVLKTVPCYIVSDNSAATVHTSVNLNAAGITFLDSLRFSTAMSNRIVPAIYKQVIEDVISACREDFEEYGVDDSLVGYLQQLWEASLVQTRVAKFVDGDDGDDSEEDEPLGGQVQGQSSTNGPANPLLNLPPLNRSTAGAGHPFAGEDVKPRIDANGNGTYNGGLRGGSTQTEGMRLRGGGVSIIAMAKPSMSLNLLFFPALGR